MRHYEEITTTLPLLNKVNGADEILHHYIKNLPNKMKNVEHFNIVLMGIAYGGDVEAAARGIGDKGTVYGFDTFEDQHPRHLAVKDSDREATCMEHWYKDNVNGTAGLDYKFQIDKLDEMKLHNTILIKGEVNYHSCYDIDPIHLAFLDMDILRSMEKGYDAVRSKMPSGAMLFMHDVTSKTNLPRLRNWFYSNLLPDKRWEVEGIWPESHLACLIKK